MSINEISPSSTSHTSHRSRPVMREPSIALVRDDVYAILDSRDTMGFVERVGAVYVAMFGDRHLTAVEVGQSLSWDVAVEMVCLAYRGRR